MSVIRGDEFVIWIVVIGIFIGLWLWSKLKERR